MPLDRRIALVCLAAALAVLVLGGRLLRAGGEAAPASSAPAPFAGAADPALSASPVLVHVAGAVRSPGVYRLRDGARVRDALRAAGGPTKHALLDGVNLATRLADGEQVLVPTRAAVSAGAAQSAVPPPGGGAPPIVHLNSASEAQLDELDGIGPALAARIVAYRQDNGSFHSVDELGDVSGIGPTRLEALRDRVAP